MIVSHASSKLFARMIKFLDLQGPVITVQITRMASKEIQDRQRMFELLELLQAFLF